MADYNMNAEGLDEVITLFESNRKPSEQDERLERIDNVLSRIEATLNNIENEIREMQNMNEG